MTTKYCTACGHHHKFTDFNPGATVCRGQQAVIAALLENESASGDLTREFGNDKDRRTIKRGINTRAHRCVEDVCECQRLNREIFECCGDIDCDCPDEIFKPVVA